MYTIRNLSNFLLFMVAIILYAGCDVYINVSTNSTADTDFSKYRTFAWLPDEIDTNNLPFNNEIILNNVRNYFGYSFAKRGYKVNLDTPDVLLQVRLTNKTKEKTLFYSPRVWPYYYHNYYYGSIYFYPYEFDYYYHDYPYCYPPDYCTQKITYNEGSITLTVVDRKKNKVVWAGSARGDIFDPAYIHENIHPSVEAIMKKYPVKPMTKKRKVRNTQSDDIYN
ncbi:MAG: DUF4136 domain-containing protein [Bacteroidetes bacterium]|nr:DUF4136 domain-containing protein [Bacteroidota bacterium]